MNYFDLTSKSKRIVFKIGTTLLVDQRGRISNINLSRFVDFFSRLIEEGREVILVTSGAVASADYSLHHSASLESEKQVQAGNRVQAHLSAVKRQALSSIGQVNLMERYRKLFGKRGLVVAQILISKFSIHHRPSYLSAQKTIQELIKVGVVPIINENDPLSTSETSFGENDLLGALTSAMVESDLYVILSNVDGFYLYYKQKREQKLNWVDRIGLEHHQAARKGKSSLGRGGMLSKIEAAQVAGNFHIPTLITSGENQDLYQSIFQKQTGTLFATHLDHSGRTQLEKKIKPRKKWLLSHVTPKGQIYIDRGAEKAIMAGKSLLPKGIVEVRGDFSSGEVCNLLNGQDQVMARGLCHFSNRDLMAIKGKNLSELEKILGHSAEKEVVHRNYLVVL